jgi:hypothetical protein
MDFHLKIKFSATFNQFLKMKNFAYLPTLIFTTMLAETHVVLRGVELKLFLVILYVFKAYFACFSKDKKCILFSNFREAHASATALQTLLSCTSWYNLWRQ